VPRPPTERGGSGASGKPLAIARPALDAAASDCERAGPFEACGVLLGTLDPVRIERAVPVDNAAREPGRSYAIPASRIFALDRAARDLGLDIVGFYHSHPTGSATPSAADLAGAWPGYVYLIVSRREGGTRTRAWRLRADRCAFEEAVIRTGTSR
jgi:proteasome lid subunit RPN8/RPN11